MKRVPQLVLVTAFSIIAAIAYPIAAEDVDAVSTGATAIKACSNAKAHAEQKCSSTKVSAFGQCQCETGEFSGGDKYQCSVEATCEVKNSGQTLGPEVEEDEEESDE